MRINYQKITVIHTSRPPSSNINDQLQWFGGSLGLFNLRDKDKSCFRIFIELIKAAQKNSSISSDELAEHLSLTRGTVVHHLNKLMESGIVVHKANHYTLRTERLGHLVDEVERDLLRMLESLKKVAADIDTKLEHE
jgi:predicted transcriptional regulator